jgi:1,4-dihydroxy-2-naphthoate octaprenyltransferase
MTYFRRLFSLSRPTYLILALLAYSLGAGIARYLGHPLHLAVFGLGALGILCLQVFSFWLVEYFRLPFAPLEKDETPRNREALRLTLLQSASAMLTVAAAVTVTLLLVKAMTMGALFLIILLALAMFLYAVPPFRFSETGHGELVLAITIGTIVPAWSYLLQYDVFHWLLTIVTFPLTLLALAYLLVWDFPTFATDQKFERHTFLTRLTWQRAIPIHHILLLTAFLLLASSPFLGVPWRVLWPVFMALPFAVVQIIWLQRIANGGPAIWRFITILSVATFGLAVYLLTLSFWLH